MQSPIARPSACSPTGTGAALREYMRDYTNWTVVGGLNELLPQPDNQITIACETDEIGIRVARMDCPLCDEDKDNMACSTKLITGILHDVGVQDVFTIQRLAHLTGGVRMGFSPEGSVVNVGQRAWTVPHLFLADGSVCLTQGSANPALTIMTLASRLAARIASGTAMDDDPAARSRTTDAARSGGTRRLQ